MAITATIVFAGHNFLRYLVTGDTPGETVTIDSDGGATPDIQTDSLGGALKAISKANVNGYGKLAAGSESIANTRALLMGDNAASLVGAAVAIALTQITGRTTGSQFIVDANPGGTYGLLVTAVVAGSCYVDVFVPGSIGT